MTEKHYFLVSVGTVSGGGSYLTSTEVAYHCGVHPELIDRFIQLGLIDFIERDRDGTALFGSDVVPLVRRILRLRNELGVNYSGIGVILDLMARVETLEDRIRELESRVFD